MPGARFISGPFQRLIRAETARTAAEAAGNMPAMRDAEIAIDRARRAIERWERGVSSSGRAMLDLGGGFTRLTAIVGTVITALTAMGRAISGAGERAAALQILGGTSEEQTRLRAIGAAIGLRESQMAQLVAELRQQRGGGRAAVELGFVPSREADPFYNEARGYLQAFDRMMRMSEEQARAVTRNAQGLEPVLRLRGNEEFLQRVGRQIQALDRLGISQERAADIQERYNVVVHTWTLAFQNAVVTIDDFITRVQNFIPTNLTAQGFAGNALARGLSTLFGNKGPQAAQKEAESRERQTAAIERNTAALEQARTTPIGGGAQARNAIPAGLGGMALNRALANGSVRVGGIDLFSD